MNKFQKAALASALLGAGFFSLVPQRSLLAQGKVEANPTACLAERDKLKQSLKAAAGDLTECGEALAACANDAKCPVPTPKPCGGLNFVKAFKEAQSTLSVREAAEISQLTADTLRDKAATASGADLQFVKSKLSASKKSISAAGDAVSASEKKAAAAAER